MKKLISVTIILALLTFFGFFLSTSFEKSKNKNYNLTKNQKIWIESMGEKKIPILISDQNSVYLYRNMDGKLQGAYYEYIKWLEKKYGLSFEFIQKGSDYFKEQLDNGDGVMAYNATSTYFREQKYTYIPLRAKTSIILVKKYGNDLKAEKIQKIGIVRNTTEAKDYFFSYSPNKYSKIYLSTYEEGIEKLENGEIDLFLGKSRNLMYRDLEMETVKKFSDLQYNFAISKNYPELIEIISKTISDFEEENFADSYFKNKTAYASMMMKNNETLKKVKEKYSKILIDFPNTENLLPVYYIKNGKFYGYLPSIFKEISNIIGIPIEFTTELNSERGRVKAISLRGKNPLNIPYYSSKVVIMGKNGNNYISSFEDLNPYLNNFSVGIVEKRELGAYSRTINNFKTFPDTFSLIKALDSGEIQYAIGDLFFLDSQIQNMHLKDEIKVLGILPDTNNTLSIGFQNEDKLLYKLFLQLFPKDISEFQHLKSMLVSPKVIKLDYYFIFSLALIFTVILSIILFFLKINIDYKKKAEKLNRAMISSLELASSYNDEDTGQHIVRVAKYSELLAKELGMASSFIKDVAYYASLHDIGKIGISDAVLKKPGKLTPEEMNEMKKHPNIGYKLVQNAGLGKIAENIVRFHHERYDGKGYPLGLLGNKIPLEARIVSLADVYDALRQKRSYKDPFTHEEAVQIITGESGVFFDPELVKLFLKLNREFDEIHSRY